MKGEVKCICPLGVVIVEDYEVCPELIRLLRAQRHEFINHAQVIHALLQLGRVEKAMKYIEDLSKGPELVEEPLRMHIQQDNCQRKPAAK